MRMTPLEDTDRKKRTIRSFVRRSGRLTASQQLALKELWPQYGLEFEERPLDFALLFANKAPTTLEIGFGNGETLLQQAGENPASNFLGIEVHQPGIGHCLIGAREAGLENLRLVAHDAIEVLQQQVPNNCLQRINLYFPDPWPKKRHHKRRIVQASLLTLCADRLKTGGALHIATDWANYAEHIDAVVNESNRFVVAERREHNGDRPLDRPRTKFEQRGLQRGHHIWDWRFDQLN